MRRFFCAASVFAILFLTTFSLLACGGGASTQTLATSAPAPSPTPSPSGGQNPSAATTVIDNIEDQPWLTCGSCGNAGGTGSTANYSATLGISSPSEDGSSTKFAIAATVAFTNGYFYQKHTPVTSQFAMLTYEFDLYIPSGSENAPQAIEFECQQSLNGWIYSFSWQADYGANTWRTYNYVAKQWEDSGLILQRFSPGSWHHILAEFHNDESTHSAFHDALTIDGVRAPVNIRHDAFNANNNNQFTNAIQLDSDRVPTAYSIFVDKMKITYQ